MYIAMNPADSHGYWVKLIPKNNDLSQKFKSKGYSYMVNHVSVNCSSNEQTIDSLLIYDIHNKLAYKQAVNSTRTLPTGTPGDRLMKLFCKKQ